MKGLVIVGEASEYGRDEIQNLAGHYDMTEGELFYHIRDRLPSVGLYTLDEFMYAVNGDEIDVANSWVATLTHN